MAPFWSSQPLKTIYTVFILLKTPPQAVTLFIRYLWKPLYPEWNAKMSLASALLNIFFQYSATTRSRHVLDNDPEKAKERLVKVEPPAAHLFCGALAPTTVVKPAPVKGVWLPSLPSHNTTELEREKVILHFPGGAFVIAFGHETSGQPAAKVLTRHLRASRVLWAQYRLAANEETRFPAALQDALTYYHYVMSLGVNPKNIILSGDSAGGNVVLALMRYLESSETPGLPLPGGAIVFSPWVHVTSHATQDYETCNNTKADILSASLLQWGAESYLPSGQLPSDTEAYISPLHHPFKTSIPLFIHAGAAEAFFGPIRSFAGEMEETNTDRVHFYTAPKAPHDLLLCYGAFGMKVELEAAVDEARDFFHKR